MSTSWSCRCGAKNDVDWRYCEGCGAELARRSETAHVSAPVPEGYAPLRPLGERPCTLEQNRAANAVFQAVLSREITREEGIRRMAELFGPEAVAECVETPTLRAVK